MTDKESRIRTLIAVVEADARNLESEALTIRQAREAQAKARRELSTLLRKEFLDA